MSEEESRALSDEYRLLIRGIEDQKTVVQVSVMIYYTKEFAYVQPNVDGYIANLFRSANAAFKNSKIPLRLKHHCTERANIAEGHSSRVLSQLSKYKGLVECFKWSD